MRKLKSRAEREQRENHVVKWQQERTEGKGNDFLTFRLPHIAYYLVYILEKVNKSLFALYSYINSMYHQSEFSGESSLLW